MLNEMEAKDMFLKVGPIAIMVYKDGDSFVAHCLTTDTIAQGATPPEALLHLRSALEDEISFHASNDTMEKLFDHPAPTELWEELEKRCKQSLHECKTVFTSESLEVVREVSRIAEALVEKGQELATS